ncbi:MAG: alpha-2-macroglobulin family protein [Flavobacteriales bacterium]
MKLKATERLCYLLAISLFLFSSCREKSLNQLFKVNPEFFPYISGFSGGMISSKSEIKVRFAFEPQGVKNLNTPITEKLFDFSPSIKGITYWSDASTIVFKPEQILEQNKVFKAKLAIGKLIDMPENLKTFEFNFKTIKQAAEIVTEGLKVNESNTEYSLSGHVISADYIGADTVKKAFEADFNGQPLTDITWKHTNGNTMHQFTINGIPRIQNQVKMLLMFDHRLTGIHESLTEEELIPAKQVFKIAKTQLINEEEPYVQIWFSDRLKQDQDLDGLISTDKDYQDTPGWSIEGNLLRIYPTSRKSGSVNVVLSHAIKNVNDKTLGAEQRLNIAIPDAKPSVSFIGNEVITPTDEGAMVYFKTTHLKSVDVKVLKIFENNIPQFLQEADLNGGYDFNRVGRVVSKTTIHLPVKNLQDRRYETSHAIKLDELIKSEPGAIYRVILSFKKEYSTYPCAGQAYEGAKLATIEKEDDETSYRYVTSYDYEEYESDYYYDEDGEVVYSYDWDYHFSQRNNPCSPSFYNNSAATTRNIIASNLALTCKMGNDRNLHIFANDILSGKPLSGVKVRVLDYQQQTLISGSTGSDGLFSKELDKTHKPFLIAASHHNQVAYLKVNEYQSLSTSNFEVSGVNLSDGIKGYLYGERGVWRPGDTMFVSFVMNEQTNPLPLSYPIIMEVMNPKWQVIYKNVQTKKKDQSLFSFAIPTDQDALTGHYTARVIVGNQEFTKTLKVETIMPNRLKINVTHQGDYLSKAKENNTINVSAKWLHGASAPGLKTIVNATVSALPIQFNNLPYYTFENPILRYQTIDVNLFDGNLDREGKVSFPVNISGQYNPPKLNLAVNVRVFEPGGAFSVDRFNVPYFSYEKFVGLRMPEGKGYYNALDINQSHRIEFATVDEKGKARGNENIYVRVFKFDYNWWWDYHENSRSIFDAQSADLVLDTTLTTSASGIAHINFKADPKAYGEYFVMTTNEEGHSSGKIFRMDESQRIYRPKDQASRDANQITFSDLKPKYEVGEKVDVNIPAPENSWVLVCMENFRSMQKFEWVKAGENGVNYTFKATADMSPNIYFSATIIQPYRSSNNDLPIRRYGIAPVMVEDPASHLNPVIGAPEQTRPNTNINLMVSEQDGKAMEYTIAIVDEGLLDLTRFKTPNPWNDIYAKTAHGVRTWDLYDMISGAFTGKLESVASIGGDDEGSAAKGNAKANRFKPMVRFLGPFNLAKGKKAQHQIHIPEYIGSVRIMVVASNHKGAYGSAKKEMQVSQPLMVLATMPRVISPEEEFLVPVSVFFDGKIAKNATVSIGHNNFFSTVSDKQATVRYAGESEEMAYFTLKSARTTGIGKVKVTAISGNEKSSHEIEIDVRPPNPPVTLQEEQMVEAGKSMSWKKENDFIAGTDVHWIELTTIPPINLKSRLRYLIQYPHGCIEQTVSGAFPQLYLSELMDLSDYEKREIDKNVKAAIKRIYKFQTASGGLSYWPGLSTDDPFATSYAGHFIIEAMNRGYQVNKGFVDKWKKYQKESAKRFANNPNQGRIENVYQNDDIIQAYRLYTLALSGSPEFTSMNKLRESKNLSTMAAWRLAAAYQLAGQREAASRLVGAIPGTSGIASYSWAYTYGSKERDEAIIIETLTLLNQKSLASPMVKSLAESLRSDRWMSTQTTAHALMAISKFFGGQKSGGNIQAEVIINGRSQMVQSGKPLVELNIEKPGKKLDLKINNKGKGTIFARVVSTGIPPAKDSKPEQSNLVMNVEFKDQQGRSVDFNNLIQSTDFVAEVVLRNPGTKGSYFNLALNAMFASGFEIANARMDETANNGDQFDYQDIRDDRVLTYFSLAPNQTKTFRFRLNATYAGKFFMPVIQCEAMYDNTVSASSSGRWIEVKRPKGPGI